MQDFIAAESMSVAFLPLLDTYTSLPSVRECDSHAGDHVHGHFNSMFS
jgi:hypothetical protein